eukprot:6195880-Pleurochrysis_carterae.AAC.2
MKVCAAYKLHHINYTSSGSDRERGWSGFGKQSWRGCGWRIGLGHKRSYMTHYCIRRARLASAFKRARLASPSAVLSPTNQDGYVPLLEFGRPRYADMHTLAWQRRYSLHHFKFEYVLVGYTWGLACPWLAWPRLQHSEPTG